MAHAPRLKLGLEFPASVNPNRSGYIYTYAWFKPGGKCMRNHVAANVIISEIQWTRSRIHYACSPVYSCGKWRKRCANERQRLMYLNHSLKKGGEGRGIPSDINVVINERSVRKCKKERRDGSAVYRSNVSSFLLRVLEDVKLFFDEEKNGWNFFRSREGKIWGIRFPRVVLSRKKSLGRNFPFLFRFALRFFAFSSTLALRNFIFDFALECETESGCETRQHSSSFCLSLRVIVGCRQFRPTWI